MARRRFFPFRGLGVEGPLPVVQPPQNIIQDPFVGEKLRRRFGLKERSPASVVSPDIQPVVIVEDLTKPTDTPQVRTASSQLSLTGDGIDIPIIRLLNPAGSNIDVVLRRIIVHHTGAHATFGFENLLPINAPVTNQPGVFWHGDLQGVPGVPGGFTVTEARVESRHSTATMSPGSQRMLRFAKVDLADLVLDLDPQVVVTPGRSVVVQGAFGAGIVLTVTYIWDESVRVARVSG